MARLNNVNVALSTRFAPKGSDKPKKANTPNTEEQQRLINANPDAYVDFNIPWTLNLSYNFGYSRQGLSKGTTIQALRVNGDFSLTPNWKFVFDTGVDVVAPATYTAGKCRLTGHHLRVQAFGPTTIRLKSGPNRHYYVT